MTEIARDPRRGVKAPRKIVCVSNKGIVPVNEIQKDPKRQGASLTMGTLFPVGKHIRFQQLSLLKEMAESGNTRPAMDEAPKMGIDSFDAAKVIASGILKYNEKLNLESVFTNIRTCPPKFLPNRARE